MMKGLLLCERCGTKAEADSYEEAASKLDHTIGQVISKPCGGSLLEQVWYPDAQEPSSGIRVADVTLNPKLKTAKESKKGKPHSEDPKEEHE